MKSGVKIALKLTLLCLFLYITPFASGLSRFFASGSDLLQRFVVPQKTIRSNVSLKDSMNLLSYNSNLTIPREDIKVETTHAITNDTKEDTAKNDHNTSKQDSQADRDKQTTQKDTKDTKQDTNKTKNKALSGKRVYLYDTHQNEAYQGGKTVLDAAAILAQKLEDRGIKVILETNDFIKYRDSHGLTYDQSYVVSYKYLTAALRKYGSFDLCLDLHRDSIPRSASVITIDGKPYAKGMMVVGGLGKNAKSAAALSATLTDTINAKKNGMMKGVLTRAAYYNQEVAPHTVLMELGGDVNSFDEVKNSLDVIADGIADVLSKE